MLVYNYFLNPFNNPYGMSIDGQGNNNSQEVFRYTLDNTLNWDRSFGLSTFNVVLGTETINENITTIASPAAVSLPAPY